jgi:hypothetical protein
MYVGFGRLICIASGVLLFLVYNLVLIGVVMGCIKVVIANGESFTDKPRLVVKGTEYIVLPTSGKAMLDVKESFVEMVIPNKGKTHVA